MFSKHWLYDPVKGTVGGISSEPPLTELHHVLFTILIFKNIVLEKVKVLSIFFLETRIDNYQCSD